MYIYFRILLAMKTSYYIVPIDFSAVTINALITACDFLKNEDATILALHIVSKKSDKIAAKQKMEEVLNHLPAALRPMVESRILVGDLFSDIGKAAEVLGAKMILMGTHGARGMQKIFGSNALKLVGSTSTPFIILQDEAKLEKLNTIVMPFNYEKESIQVINYVAYLGKKFNSTIHLLSSHEEDQWLKGKIFSNQTVVRNILETNDLSYEMVNLPKAKNLVNEVVDYAKKVNADIVAASFFSDALIQSMNPFIQGLIENESNIPFLTVNAEDSGVITKAVHY